MGRGQDAAKNSTMHRRASHNKELSNPNVNGDEVEKHFYKVFVIGNRPQATVGAYWEVCARLLPLLLGPELPQSSQENKLTWSWWGKGQTENHEDKLEPASVCHHLDPWMTCRRSWCPAPQSCTWPRTQRSWWRLGGSQGAAGLGVASANNTQEHLFLYNDLPSIISAVSLPPTWFFLQLF